MALEIHNWKEGNHHFGARAQTQGLPWKSDSRRALMTAQGGPGLFLGPGMSNYPQRRISLQRQKEKQEGIEKDEDRKRLLDLVTRFSGDLARTLPWSGGVG